MKGEDVAVTEAESRRHALPGDVARRWLLEGLAEKSTSHVGPHSDVPRTEERHSWWRVMCLTGVDYFSTLGYQPGIAVLAAGAAAPIATIVLVALTLFGALPVYRRVARESPNGQGSIAMLERLLSFWKGKIFVITLLGFAATDFLITITLSAADATAHLVENPFVPNVLGDHRVLVTLALVALLGGIFLKGFSEAIGIAVALVIAYLALNFVVVAVGLWHVVIDAGVVGRWSSALSASHGNTVMVIAFSLVIFPKLALGLSGFETGVAVMPHIQGARGEENTSNEGRIAGARRLLTTAALIMSAYLILSSIVTTLLIPSADFQAGGPANGRALAYLAHLYLGSGFGTVYDVVTIAILWFAGASAMAGMLNLIPRYLPRYGMAPDWARAVRPMVLVLTATAFLVTWIFDADVNAQGGAYATGVLVLITSAAVAVMLSAHRSGERRKAIGFGAVAAIFAYTTGANVLERPDGVKIGACFITALMLISFGSRLNRAFELRVTDVELDETARIFLRDCARREFRLVAHETNDRGPREYAEKLRHAKREFEIPDEHDVIFVEVEVTDPSDFESTLSVHGQVMHGRYRVLSMTSTNVPNTPAALLLKFRDETGQRPHIYLEWTEGNPVAQMLRYMLFGMGEIAPVTREILRRAEPVRRLRPHVHVG